MTGTMMSETIEKGKPFPLKNAELKTEGIRFAQPAMNNALISTGIAGKPVMAQKSNNFVDIGKKVRKSQTSTTPFMKTTNALPGILLGVTYYDLQSNGSMPHRISYFEEGNDKSAQVIWMGASDMERFNPPHPTRGSYYALVDMADPLNPEKYTDIEWNRIEGTIRSGFPSIVQYKDTDIEWNRIEGTIRSGFPSIVQYKDGTVGSIAHVISSESSASAMRITKNTGFGDIAFTSKQIPGADSSLWGHATVDGDDITHLAFTSDTSSKNFGEQVVYMRSTDKGNTWSDPTIMTGPLSNPQLPTGRGANSYQLATRGSTVLLHIKIQPSIFALSNQKTMVKHGVSQSMCLVVHAIKLHIWLKIMVMAHSVQQPIQFQFVVLLSISSSMPMVFYTEWLPALQVGISVQHA